jgi:hypothetical protein
MKERKGKDGGIRGGAPVKLRWSFGGALGKLQRSSGGGVAAPRWTSGQAVVGHRSWLPNALSEDSLSLRQ